MQVGSKVQEENEASDIYTRDFGKQSEKRKEKGVMYLVGGFCEDQWLLGNCWTGVGFRPFSQRKGEIKLNGWPLHEADF
jgi:hypothetical protein